ncbi:Extracellular matrix-binding protein ebh, partial [Bienertia sinuspersici]
MNPGIGNSDSNSIYNDSNSNSIAKPNNLGLSYMNGVTGSSGIVNSTATPKPTDKNEVNGETLNPITSNHVSGEIDAMADNIVNDNGNLKNEPQSKTINLETLNLWLNVIAGMGANPPFSVMDGYYKRIYGKNGLDKASMRDPDMELHKDSVKTISIWIRFPKWELKYWGSKFLHKLGDSIGTTLKIDHVNLNKERLAYTRLLVEVRLNRDLLDKVCFQNEKGMCMEQPIEYKRKPIFCTRYKRCGHAEDRCNKEEGYLWIQWVHPIYVKEQIWVAYSPTQFCSWVWKIFCKIKDSLVAAQVDLHGPSYSIKQVYELLRPVGSKIHWHKA